MHILISSIFNYSLQLVSCGIFPLKEGLPLLGNLLTVLTVGDREDHGNVSIVLSFCRHCGEDYAGLVPRKYRLLSEKFNIEIPKSNVCVGWSFQFFFKGLSRKKVGLFSAFTQNSIWHKGKLHKIHKCKIGPFTKSKKPKTTCIL